MADWPSETSWDPGVHIPTLPHLLERDRGRLVLTRENAPARRRRPKSPSPKSPTDDIKIVGMEPLDILASARLSAWLQHLRWCVHPFELVAFDIDLATATKAPESTDPALPGRFLRTALGASLDRLLALGDHGGISLKLDLEYECRNGIAKAKVPYGGPGPDVTLMQAVGLGFAVGHDVEPLWQAIAGTVMRDWLQASGVRSLVLTWRSPG